MTGEVGRPAFEDEAVAADTTANADTNADQGQGNPSLLVGERRIGPFRRHFNFPMDVEMGKLKAKLESGLLLIRVPKELLYEAGEGKVDIE